MVLGYTVFERSWSALCLQCQSIAKRLSRASVPLPPSLIEIMNADPVPIAHFLFAMHGLPSNKLVFCIARSGSDQPRRLTGPPQTRRRVAMRVPLYFAVPCSTQTALSRF